MQPQTTEPNGEEDLADFKQLMIRGHSKTNRRSEKDGPENGRDKWNRPLLEEGIGSGRSAGEPPQTDRPKGEGCRHRPVQQVNIEKIVKGGFLL